mgnify:CR=1 FL=1
MLSTISWSQYVTFVCVVLLFYYCFIGLKYYRWEILNLIGIRKVEKEKILIPVDEGVQHFRSVENPEDYLPKPAVDADISPVMQSFIDETQAYIQEARPNVQQQELSYSLQVIAAKYPVLKDADCRDELVQMVFTEVNNKYPGLVELSELKQLWK